MKINHKLIFSIFMVLGFFFMIQCGKDDDKVVGPNRIEKIEIDDQEPWLIADGISTASIIAVVYDTSGYPAQGVRVNFTTNHGSITSYSISNVLGETTAILTSVASDVDLDVTVTATIQDSSSLNKKIPDKHKVVLKVKNFSQTEKLKKVSGDASDTATIDIKFIGVTLTAVIDQKDIPADGINTAKLEVVIKETVSKKAVPGADIFLRAIYNTVPGQLKTSERGVAAVDLVSLTRAIDDTIFIDYGTFESKQILLSYVTPKLNLFPEIAQLSADGKSKLVMTARLTTHKNNPIVGANVNFITSDGSITATAVTNEKGDALADLVSGSSANPNVQVISSFYNVSDTAQISFVESAGQTLFSLTGNQVVIRNGISAVKLTATLLDDQQNPVKDTKLRFKANYGVVDSVAITDENGQAEVDYISDADSVDARDVITATFGTMTTTLPIDLLGVSMQVSANPDSIQADGIASSVITVQLKLTTTKDVIPYAVVNFNSNLGSIPNQATTDVLGTAKAELISESQAGIAYVNVFYGGLYKTVPIIFASEKPTTILLTAEPNFIWVKETGNLEQTTLTARVLSQTGTPVSNDVSVKFTLLNGPGGGESIFPAKNGSLSESVPIKTVDGEAKATLKAGTRSGTVRIMAEVVGEYDITARIANVVIRSGPPYMWIDPNDKNHVESHMTIAFDYINRDGWHNVKDYEVTVYVGDRYNNPVEEGTTVYLTSTAGIITTDVKTDANGVGTAILRSANPKPYLNPSDPFVLAPHRIPNPNAPDLMLDIQVPDFEGSEVLNSLGNYGENDGMAFVLAKTQGCDQYLHQSDHSDSTVMVYTYGGVIFSGPLNTNPWPDGQIQGFRVNADKTSLKLGEAAVISIRVYDINGNPVSQGSTLTASSSKGRLAQTTFMPSPEKYGLGSTFYSTYLLNNLDPIDDKAGTAEITFNLESPNGSATKTIFIYLSLEEP